VRVLCLTRYESTGASSRVRSFQYVPYLANLGIDVTVSPLFHREYVSRLQLGQRRLVDIVASYIRRVSQLLATDGYDLIWVEKELLPWLPFFLEFLFLRHKAPYVLDYDDAVFHTYDQHHYRLIRKLFADKHPSLMRNSAAVVAGNRYLADHARKSHAPTVHIVPTVIDLNRYRCKEYSIDASGPPVVGRIGQRSTASYLKPLSGLFSDLVSEGLARFIAVGIDAREQGLPMQSVPWTEDGEVASILGMDIGIMPVRDAPFERGKCGYKLIQYMACGLPVIASPVGVNTEIVEHGVNGFLAESEEDWSVALRTLLLDKSLRQRMGASGRKKVENQYCVQVTAPRVAAILKNAALATA